MRTLRSGRGKRRSITFSLIPVVVALLVGFGLLGGGTSSTAHAAAGEVVMLGFDTDTPHSAGLKAAFEAAGETVVVMSPAEWAGLTQTDFDAYDAVVIGDPTCSFFANGADVNAEVWGPIVDGNVIVIGTDEQFHAGQGGQALMNAAAAFVLAEAGKTGAYVSMSCGGAFDSAATDALNAAFGGTWTAVGTACGTNVKIVATHPALSGLTDATLSDWGCSTHNAFSSWPLDFEVLAMALEGGFFTAPDGTVGSPYILARGVQVISDIDLSPETDTNPVGTTHTVTATVTHDDPVPGTPVVGTTVTFTVIAGPNMGQTSDPGECSVNANCTTDAAGNVSWTYTGSGGPGVDTIEATFVDADGPTQRSNRVEKIWEEPQGPAQLTLSPGVATNPVDSKHCVTATVLDAAGNPVEGVEVVFMVTGSVSTTGMAMTDANGEAVFCYAGPALPGADTIMAFADTDGDGVQDEDEPFATAGKRWAVPASTEGCKVTYGGRITAKNGDKATFGGNATAPNKGVEEYQDHGPAVPMNVHSTDVQAVVCSRDKKSASIFGTATINGSGTFNYRIDVQDLDEPGKTDTYRIRLSNGYDSGVQTLNQGNIQIHK